MASIESRGLPQGVTEILPNVSDQITVTVGPAGVTLRCTVAAFRFFARPRLLTACLEWAAVARRLH